MNIQPRIKQMQEARGLKDVHGSRVPFSGRGGRDSIDMNALEEAAARLRRGDVAECLVQIERAYPPLDGLAAKLGLAPR